jgi:hypothetical protein
MVEKPGVSRRKFLTNRLLQLGVFGFCSDEDGDIGVGIFPEREEIVVGGASLRRVALQCIGAGKAEVRDGSRFTRPYQPSTAENFLKLGSSGDVAMNDAPLSCAAWRASAMGIASSMASSV